MFKEVWRATLSIVRRASFSQRGDLNDWKANQIEVLYCSSYSFIVPA